jgi:hypothetical protein
MVKIFDLTDYSMHPLDGLQYYSREEAESKIPKKLKKQFKVEKDEKPTWYGSDKWKQTYTIRRR